MLQHHVIEVFEVKWRLTVMQFVKGQDDEFIVATHEKRLDVAYKILESARGYIFAMSETEFCNSRRICVVKQPDVERSGATAKLGEKRDILAGDIRGAR
jgi:hypothetical protein